MNADTGNYDGAVVLWGMASVALGLVARDFRFVLLPLLAIPTSVAFGYPERYVGGEPAPIWWFGAMFGVLSGMVIALAVALGLVVEQWRAVRREAAARRG